MKKTHNLSVKNGTYKDQTGAEKGRWLNIGSIFERDDGTLSIKFDCMPIVEGGWNGWVNAFPYSPEDYQNRQPAQPQQRPPRTVSSPPRQNYNQPPPADDDIPF